MAEADRSTLTEAAETVSHLGYYERFGRGPAALNDEERAKLAAARRALEERGA